MIELHNIDCMEYMRTLPDKAFELAIVDPPYGIGMGGGTLDLLQEATPTATRRSTARMQRYRLRTISTNCAGCHTTKSFGAATT